MSRFRLKCFVALLFCACTVTSALISAGGDIAFHTFNRGGNKEIKRVFVPYLGHCSIGPFSAKLKYVALNRQKVGSSSIFLLPLFMELGVSIWSLRSWPVDLLASGSAGYCFYFSPSNWSFSNITKKRQFVYDILLSAVVGGNGLLSARAFVGYASFGEPFKCGTRELSIQGLTFGLGFVLQF